MNGCRANSFFKPGRRAYAWAAALLFAAAAAVRVFGAWTARFTMDPDYGVAALMSKDIAQGVRWPVFFYGQPYLGSIEPALGALFCRLLGVSEFSVCLGTALAGFLTAAAVFFWAREAGGPAAGLVALALIVVGPAGYFPYMSLPRGGYALAALSVACMLWLAARIAALEMEKKPAGLMQFFLLGAAAGAGWWTSGVTVSAIAAAGIVVFIAMAARRKHFFIRSALGTLGFALASLPFWVWDARYEWDTFRYYLENQAQTGFLRHFGRFLFERLPYFEGITDAAPWLKAATAAMLLIIIVAGIAALAGTLRAGQRRGFAHLAAIYLFLVFFALSFSRSRFAMFHTVRYLVPLAPPLVVLIGVVSARALRRMPFWLALLPAAFLLGLELPVLRETYLKNRELEAGRKRQIEGLVAALESRGEDTVYLPFSYFWMNFAAREKYVFIPFFGERYRPYSEKAELKDSMTALGNYGGVRDFLRVAGGSAECNGLTGNFAAPPLAESELAPEEIAKITDSRGNEVRNILTDADIDTFLKDVPAPEHETELVVEFRRPAEICGLRIFSRNMIFPNLITVEAWPADKSEQAPTALLDRAPTPNFFWSGPRPFWHGRFMRLELRFKPIAAGRVRLRFGVGRHAVAWQPAELQFFTPASALPPERESLAELLRVLREKGVSRLYSDRWVANAVYRETGGAIRTELARIFYAPDSAFAYLPVLSNEVQLEPGVAMLALARDASLCRRAFAERALRPAETAVGPWVLFELGSDVAACREDGFSGLYWAGFGALACDNKRWAYELKQRADAEFARSGVSERAAALLEEALKRYPHWPSEAERLAQWLERLGRGGQAAYWRAAAEEMTAMECEAHIRFRNGVEFLGVSGIPARAQPGETIKIKYFWRCSEDFSQTRPLSVFIHFIFDDKLVFQDDRALLEGFDWKYQPIPEIFVEERLVQIPSDAPEGRYEMRLGIFSPQDDNARVAFRTKLSARRRSAKLPVELEIRR